MLIAQAVNSSMNLFMARGLNIEATDSGWSNKLGGWMLQILGGVMAGSMVGSFAFGSFSALHTRHKMMTKWKTAYVRAVLRQDIGWYDMHQGQKLAGQMGEAMIHIDTEDQQEWMSSQPWDNHGLVHGATVEGLLPGYTANVGQRTVLASQWVRHPLS